MLKGVCSCSSSIRKFSQQYHQSFGFHMYHVPWPLVLSCHQQKLEHKTVQCHLFTGVPILWPDVLSFFMPVKVGHTLMGT